MRVPARGSRTTTGRPLRDGARRSRGVRVPVPEPDDADIAAARVDIVEQLAALHAQFWEIAALRGGGDLAWFAPQGDRRAATVARIRADGRRHLGDQLPTGSSRSRSSISLRSGHRCGCNSGPRTLVHGDPHLGNLFVDPDDGDRTGFLDWAMIGHSPGMRDVAYVFCNSIPPEVRARTRTGSCCRYCDLAGGSSTARRLGAVPPLRRVLVGFGDVDRRNGLEVAAAAHRARRNRARDGARRDLDCVGLLADECSPEQRPCGRLSTATWLTNAEGATNVRVRHVAQLARRHAGHPRRTEGQGHAARERCLVLRADPAVRRARAARGEVQAPRASTSSASRATSSASRSRARPTRSRRSAARTTT